MSDSALNRRHFLRRAALAASTLGSAALVTPLAGCSNDDSTLRPGDPQGPTAPTGLTGQAVLSTQIDLQWVDASADELGYEVQRRLGGEAFTHRATTGVDQSNFSDTGLLPETAYEYRVRALGERGVSAFTDPVVIRTPAAPSDAPNAPTVLAAHDLTPGSVRLTWQDNAANETHFRVEMRTGGGDFASRAVLPADSVEYRAEGLAADTTYAFRILALNEAGVSAPSNPVTVRTGVAADGLTLAPAAAPGSLVLNWVDRVDGGASFRVERRIGSGDFAALATVGVGVTTLTDAQLAPGQTHAYRVVAEGLVALPGAPATIDVPELPGVPANFAVTAAPDNGEHVLAGWGAGPGGAPAAYQLERRQPPGDYAALDLGADPAVLSHADNSTAALTNYTYRVRALNLAGVSAYAGPLTIGTRAVFTKDTATVSGRGTMEEVLTTVGKGCIVRLSRPPRDFGSTCGGSTTFLWVIRESEAQVRALVGHCTHQCFAAPTLLYVESQQLIHCNAHGSEFSLSGAVTQGPAGAPLPAFQTQLFAERIEIFRA